ncbi:hypothetical protein N9164_17150, partial [Draconibacterium sp.]|nr:hypothetical protein [Draconibacterium sp.]
FCGVLKGAGKGKTVVTSIEQPNFDDVVSQNLYPVLLKFVGGDVCVKNITFLNNAENTYWFEGFVGFFGWSQVYEPENWYINVVIDNIEMISESRKVGYGVMTGSDSKGMPGGVPFCNIDIAVTNSYFAECNWYGLLIMQLAEGNVKVGSKNSGNTFVNTNAWSYGNLGFYHFVNTKVSVVGNHFESNNGRSGGIDLANGAYLSFNQGYPQEYATVVTIEHNTFDVSDYQFVFLIGDNWRWDYPDDEPMLVQLKSNKITSNNISWQIIRFGSVSEAVVRNNKFSGGGEIGLYAYTLYDVFSENCLMLGNNFTNASYNRATIELDEGTRNWTIVGGNIGQDVIDNGENNLISGFNNNTSDIPFGQTIVDNLDEMKGPMHDLKGH